MKVLLKVDVKSLGKKNDVVDVSEGYARNYLIPRNQAVIATDGVLRGVEEQKKNEKKREDREVAEAKALAGKLSSLKVEIIVKAGEGGRLFGSVAGKDIADTLKRIHNIDIDKRKIELSEPIKSLGAFKVPIRVYTGVLAEIEVVIKEA
jgi:large subunit ribosomal protein L9